FSQYYLLITNLHPELTLFPYTTLFRSALAMDELQLRIALREKNQHMAAIDNLRAGVLVTDPMAPDNPIIFCNPGFSKMTGYSAEDRKSTRLNSSHEWNSYAVFCLKKKN